MAVPAQFSRLAVALAFAGVAALLTNTLYNERDRVFEWSWTKAHGKFDASPDEEHAKAARAFAEGKRPGQACVEKWLGKDEKYLYLALGCARFEETLGEVKALDGDHNFLATRMRYSGDTVQSIEQPHPQAYQNSLRRLFPVEAAEKLRHSTSLPEFHSQGIARMEQIRGK